MSSGGVYDEWVDWTATRRRKTSATKVFGSSIRVAAESKRALEKENAASTDDTRLMIRILFSPV